MFVIKDNLYQKIGEIGVYIYALSLFCSKAGINIGNALLLIAFLLYLYTKRKIRLTTEEKYILIILILLPIFSFFSAGGEYSFKRALEKTHRYLPVFFIPLFLNSERIIKNSLSLLSCSLIVSFIHGIFFYKKLKWNFGARLISFTSHPLDEAHILAMGSLLILGILIYIARKKNIKYEIFYGITFILALIALVFTQGRGAWLGFLAGLGAILFILIKNKKILIISTLLIGIFVGVFLETDIFQNNRYIKRFESIKNLEDTSNKIRIFMWESSIDMFKNNFPFGVGRDNAGKFALEYMKKNKKYKQIKAKKQLKEIAASGNLHSLYFTSLAEEGVLSLGFIGMFGYIFIKQIKYCRYSKKKDFGYFIVLGTTGMLVAFAVGGLTENVWREIWKSNMLIFGLSLYLAVKKKDWRKDAEIYS